MRDSMIDVAVIGGGPAGLAAAATCAEAGLTTYLIDEQASPGGQIYRAIADTPVADRAILGADYWRGEALVAAFQRSGAVHLASALAWDVTPDLEVAVSVGGGSRFLRARRVIIASGALERPMPVPGWTLPGVMTVGAGQILLKSSGAVPSGRVVLAGCGPLLYLLAAQYRRAGAEVALILDTTPAANFKRALRHLPEFLLAGSYLAKGAELLLSAQRSVEIVRGVDSIVAAGEGQLRSVRYNVRGQEREVSADLLLLHQGVVPNVNLSMAIGCAHDWDGEQLCWSPRLDAWSNATVGGVAIAGDGAGIGGAAAAAERGRIAALDAARHLGVLSEAQRDLRAAGPRAALRRAMRGRRFLDLLYAPAPSFRVPADNAVACRCEEVVARQIRDCVALGVPGPNQMKSFLRCGMGPCQGRLCGLTVTETIAAARGVAPGMVGHYRIRPPIKPITLGEIALLPKSEAAIKAVARG
ncbi:MAG: FAD-dependent oxidoreductase [Alphaproteobacteria bacterium]|nr:FAD-dependent oxidoreductase [Alphaproteobacteria bacterium]